MDSSKNSKAIIKIIKPSKQDLTKTKNLTINYLDAKTPELKDKHLNVLKNFLLARKKKEGCIKFNSVADVKIPNSTNTKYYNRYIDVALEEDDVKLFGLLMEVGLDDQLVKDLSLICYIVHHNAIKCFKLFINRGDFKRHFSEGKYSPLIFAVTTAPIYLEMILSHPDFDPKYFSYEVACSNPLIEGVAHFNFEASKTLLNLGAPCTLENKTKTAFDATLNVYLDFYSQDKATEYLEAKEGLYNIYGTTGQPTLKDSMVYHNIIKIFYLLLNQTPHILNKYQLNFTHDERASTKYIFEVIDDVLNNVKINKGSIKLLLDILLSVGPGLYFNILPESLKNLYKDVPSTAEMVMPIMLSDNKTEYFYTYKELELFLLNKPENFIPISAMIQFFDNELKNRSCEDFHYSQLENLKNIIKDIPGFNTMEQTIVWPKHEKINLSLSQPPLEILSQGLQSIKQVLKDEENICVEFSQEIFTLYDLQQALICEENYPVSGPLLYPSLIRLNEMLMQLVLKKKLNVVIIQDLTNAKLLFEKVCQRIDVHTITWLSMFLTEHKTSDKELIDIVNLLISICKVLGRELKLTEREVYLPALLRLEVFLKGIVIDLYVKNNQLKLAYNVYKQYIVTFEIAFKSNSFKNRFKSSANEKWFVDIIQSVSCFAINNLSAKEIQPYLCQVLNSPIEILNESFVEQLLRYMEGCFSANLFFEVKDLMIILKEKSIKNKIIDSEYIETVKKENLQNYIEKQIALVKELAIDDLVKVKGEDFAIKIDLNPLSLKLNEIKRLLPADFAMSDKLIQIKSVDDYSKFDLKILLQTIARIKKHHLEKTNKIKESLSEKLEPSKPSTSSTCTNEIKEDLVLNMSYLSLYDRHKTIKPNKVRSKNASIQNNDVLNKNEKIIIPEEKFNRSELKDMANIGTEYSELIMIFSPYFGNNKKFLAIKKSKEFESFFDACHHFKNVKGEWAVKSINPYGKNQHGVKLYENKQNHENLNNNNSATSTSTTTTTTSISCNNNSNLKSEKYLIKIKGCSSERAIGTGKEVGYMGKKIIVYTVDTVLTHKKADKKLKF